MSESKSTGLQAQGEATMLKRSFIAIFALTIALTLSGCGGKKMDQTELYYFQSARYLLDKGVISSDDLAKSAIKDPDFQQRINREIVPFIAQGLPKPTTAPQPPAEETAKSSKELEEFKKAVTESSESFKKLVTESGESFRKQAEEVSEKLSCKIERFDETYRSWLYRQPNPPLTLPTPPGSS